MDPFRSDLEAAHAKIARLEQDKVELERRASTAEESARGLREGATVEARAGRTKVILLTVAILGIVGAILTTAVFARPIVASVPPPPTIGSASQDQPGIAIAGRAVAKATGTSTGATDQTCGCEPGDPLCSCIDSPNGGRASPLDRRADMALLDRWERLVSALGTVDLAPCRDTSGRVSGTGHAKVTFAPTGHALRAEVDAPPYAGTRTGTGIEAAFGRMTVPAFAGAPLTVGKSFTL
ncbi:MAG: virulence associated protein [Myxococcaceae bacterium]|nr:virulence associated protein [Myxococcaceae bacterium]